MELRTSARKMELEVDREVHLWQLDLEAMKITLMTAAHGASPPLPLSSLPVPPVRPVPMPRSAPSTPSFDMSKRKFTLRK